MLDWLVASGADAAVADTPRSWLAPRAEPAAQRAPERASERAAANAATMTARPAAPAAAPVPAAILAANIADSIAAAGTTDALLAALMDYAHPLRRADIAPQLVSGTIESGIVILCDRPEPDGPVTVMLDRMLAAIGLDWTKAALVHRLPWPTIGNTEAREEQFAAFAPFVSRLFTLAPPRFILALGQASSAIAGPAASVGRARGGWFDFGGARLMPSFHPRRLHDQPALKAKAFEDLKAFAAGIAAP